MICEEIESLFFKKVDGEITEEELQLLGEHLAICKACRKEEIYWSIMERGVKEFSREYNLFQSCLSNPFSEREAALKERVDRDAEKFLKSMKCTRGTSK